MQTSLDFDLEIERQIESFLEEERPTIRAIGKRLRTRLDDAIDEARVCYWRALRKADPAKGSVKGYALRSLHNALVDDARKRLTHSHDLLSESLPDPKGMVDVLERMEVCEEVELARRAGRGVYDVLHAVVEAARRLRSFDLAEIRTEVMRMGVRNPQVVTEQYLRKLLSPSMSRQTGLRTERKAGRWFVLSS